MGGSSPEGIVAFFGALVAAGVVLGILKDRRGKRHPGLGLACGVLGALGVAFYSKVFEGMLRPTHLAGWALFNVVWFTALVGFIVRRLRARR